MMMMMIDDDDDDDDGGTPGAVPSSCSQSPLRSSLNCP